MADKKTNNNGFEYNSSNLYVDEYFDYRREIANTKLGENFVYKHEENKITYTNNVGQDGREVNELHSKSKSNNKKFDDENDLKNEESSSSPSSSSSSSTSSTSSSGSSANSGSAAGGSSAAASGAASGAAAGGSIAGTIATVATTAVVVVVGGSLVVYGQTVEKPQIVEFEQIEASTNSIFYTLMLGNDKEKIISGEENNECNVVIELTCESYKEFNNKHEVKNFGVVEAVFNDLTPSTEYTLNVYQTTMLDLEVDYLIEPIKISTLDEEPEIIVPTAITFNIETETLDLYIDDVIEIGYTVTPSEADDSVIWASSNGEVVSVTDGTVTALSVGEAEITATSTLDPDVFASIMVSVREREPDEVLPTNIVLEEEMVDLIVGDTHQINVTVEPENTTDPSIRYETSDANVVTVTQDGLITAVGGGEATITLTCVANNEISEEIVVFVQLPAPTEIELNEGELMLIVDETFTLEATCLPEGSDQSVTWTTSDEAIASVSEEGVVTAIAEGSAEIIATSTRDENITARAIVNVSPKPATYTLNLSRTTNPLGLYTYYASFDIENETLTYDFFEITFNVQTSDSEELVRVDGTYMEGDISEKQQLYLDNKLDNESSYIVILIGTYENTETQEREEVELYRDTVDLSQVETEDLAEDNKVFMSKARFVNYDGYEVETKYDVFVQVSEETQNQYQDFLIEIVDPEHDSEQDSTQYFVYDYIQANQKTRISFNGQASEYYGTITVTIYGVDGQKTETQLFSQEINLSDLESVDIVALDSVSYEFRQTHQGTQYFYVDAVSSSGYQIGSCYIDVFLEDGGAQVVTNVELTRDGNEGNLFYTDDPRAITAIQQAQGECSVYLRTTFNSQVSELYLTNNIDFSSYQIGYVEGCVNLEREVDNSNPTAQQYKYYVTLEMSDDFYGQYDSIIIEVTGDLTAEIIENAKPGVRTELVITEGETTQESPTLVVTVSGKIGDNTVTILGEAWSF